MFTIESTFGVVRYRSERASTFEEAFTQALENGHIDFRGVNFRGYDIKNGLSFNGVNFNHADFRDMNLAGLDFSFADLSSAQFENADLENVNLRYSKLYKTSLIGANVKYAQWPSPTEVLLADWSIMDDKDLTRDLMNYDAQNHHNPMLFEAWANGGRCPYADTNYRRSANFDEWRHHWKPTIEPVNGYDLMARLLDRYCVGFTRQH